MNKKKDLVIFLLLLLALFLYVNIQKIKTKNRNVVTNETEQIQEDNSLVLANSFSSKTLNTGDDLYTKIEIKYPYFNKADNSFNQKIEEFLLKVVEEHKKISEENWKARFVNQGEGENIPEIPQEGEKFYLNSDFEVLQSNNDYISAILTYGAYEGGAHGYQNKISFNYDVKNQKELMLKDLFSPGFDYLNYLKEESRKILKEQFVEEDMWSVIDSGTEAKEENFAIWTFVNEKVRIYFGQYQVGPYVMGMPEIEAIRQ